MSIFRPDSEESKIVYSLKEMYDYFKEIFDYFNVNDVNDRSKTYYGTFDNYKNGIYARQLYYGIYNRYRNNDKILICIRTQKSFFGINEFILIIEKEDAEKDNTNFSMLKEIEKDNLKLAYYLNNFLFLFQFKTKTNLTIKVYFSNSLSLDLYEYHSYNSHRELNILFDSSIFLFSSIFQLMVKKQIFFKFKNIFFEPYTRGFNNDISARIFLSDSTFMKKEELELNRLTKAQYKKLLDVTISVNNHIQPPAEVFPVIFDLPGRLEELQIMHRTFTFDTILQSYQILYDLILSNNLNMLVDPLPIQTYIFVINAFAFYILYVCDTRYITYLLDLFLNMIIDQPNNNQVDNDVRFIYYIRFIFYQMINPEMDIPDARPYHFLEKRSEPIYLFFNEARKLMFSPDPSKLFSSFIGQEIISRTDMSELGNGNRHIPPEVLSIISGYLPGNFNLSSTTDNTGPLQSRLEIPYPNLNRIRNKGIVNAYKKSRTEFNPLNAVSNTVRGVVSSIRDYANPDVLRELGEKYITGQSRETRKRKRGGYKKRTKKFTRKNKSSSSHK